MKLKKFLYLVCGFVAVLTIFYYASSTASALEFDASQSFTGTFKTSTCFYRAGTPNANTYPDSFGCTHTQYGNLGGFVVQSNQTLPAGSFLLIPIAVSQNHGGGSSPTSVANDASLFIQVSELSKAAVYDVSPAVANYFEFSDSGSCGSFSECKTSYFDSVFYLKVYIQEDTTSVRFQINSDANFNIVYAKSYNLIKLSGAQEEIKQEIQEQGEKEDQRYEDAQNKANDAQNNGQSSSDQAQTDVSNDSKNLLQILTDFVSSISNTSAGTCNISGDFGFFDAGDINLCSGASKIVPITTVVGTVMLVGLTIPAVISLLHRFLDLYNEVMN